MERAEVYSLLIVLLFAFASTLPCTTANFIDFDEVWQKRAAEAWNRTLESYEPNPAKIVSHLNLHADRYIYIYELNLGFIVITMVESFENCLFGH